MLFRSHAKHFLRICKMIVSEMRILTNSGRTGHIEFPIDKILDPPKKPKNDASPKDKTK